MGQTFVVGYSCLTLEFWAQMMRLFGYSERLGSCDHCILGYHLRVYSGLTGCFGSIFIYPLVIMSK